MALAAARFCLATSPLSSRYCVCDITPHPVHGTLSSRIRPRLMLSSLAPSNRGYTCAHAEVNIRVVHALDHEFNVLLNAMPAHGCLFRAGIVYRCTHDFHLHAVPFHEALSVVRDVMGMSVSSSDAWLMPVSSRSSIRPRCSFARRALL
ncbi:hypothetical protein EDB89DRAFT_1966940 [Lactarius sanguifluus]|nr:hypothetical protein EDB89DRAFT_1966940 [Lactarius sanguifluus]